jgi:uncharacterized protein YijF (DUF1287 family)
MRLLNKKKIVILVVVLGVICGVGIYFLAQYQNTSARRPEDHYGGSISQVHSSVDKDEDGVDDQTDILEGALSYVATKPKYKSKYYQTGYPDDQYGVCTDVVANAMKSAGYDLMELVQEDIAKNPDDYDIEEPDANIDFRRVKNLKVYFAHTAVSLTTDVSQIEEWQGGDIVIFKQHIGVVSDRRNENGVPYVIHHNGPKQTAYEQDILEKRNDLVAHYRVTE